MRAEYREEPCRSALNRVRGMPFNWSLNPYMGCAHQCTFCYVRAFERRADRPSDEREQGVVLLLEAELSQVLHQLLNRQSAALAEETHDAVPHPVVPPSVSDETCLVGGILAAVAEEEQPFLGVIGVLRQARYSGHVVLEYNAAEDAKQVVPRYLKQLRELIS